MFKNIIAINKNFIVYYFRWKIPMTDPPFLSLTQCIGKNVKDKTVKFIEKNASLNVH